MNTIEVKYTVANNSIHAKEPKKSTSGSAGYDLFAAEEKTLFIALCFACSNRIKNENSSWLFS